MRKTLLPEYASTVAQTATARCGNAANIHACSGNTYVRGSVLQNSFSEGVHNEKKRVRFIF